MTGSDEPRLPPGYRLDRSDPDVWALRRPEGWVVAYFSAWGATREANEEAAKKAGIRRVALPQSGRPTKKRKEYER